MDGTEALFRAVHEDPQSDERRLTLATALLEAGDPRGELISLQLARARVERDGGVVDAKLALREAALIRKHAKNWIGKLAAVTVRDWLVFERGFLVAAAFHSRKSRDADAAVGAPEWSTVRILARSGFRALPAAVVLHPVMRSLLTIGVPLETVASLLNAPPDLLPRTTRDETIRMSPSDALDVLSPAEAASMFERPPDRALVALRIYRETSEPLTEETTRALGGARHVPHLRYLRLALNGPPSTYRWLFGSPLTKQLDVLVIDLDDLSGAPHQWFGEWHRELATASVAPATMRLAQWGFELCLSRDDGGAYSILEIEIGANSQFKPNLDILEQLIAQLPNDALSVVRMRTSIGDPTRLVERLKRDQTQLRETQIQR